jgi:hypothetical protein
VKRFLVAIFCASTCYGSAILVTNPTAVGTSDVVNWNQLGLGEQSQTFFASSTDYDSISGHLTNPNAQVAKACASGCGLQANGGIAANDDLLLSGTGPTSSSSSVTVSMTSGPVYGLGGYVEAVNAANGDAGAQFTVQIQAFDGVSSVLSTTALVTSDGSGDAIFVGVSDLTQEITKVVFSLTDSSGNPVAGNFALDKLYIQNSPLLAPPPPVAPLATAVPEPGMAFLVGPALLALIFGLKKRSARA